MKLIVTTTTHVDGYYVKTYKGVVRGIAVRSLRTLQAQRVTAKDLLDDEHDAFTEMCQHTRKRALDLMEHDAFSLGANAVIDVRYETAEAVSGGAVTEVVCYGTAVVLAPVSK